MTNIRWLLFALKIELGDGFLVIFNMDFIPHPGFT